ncbi:hypothetical protein [Hydrogenivirga sp.]
MLRVAIAGIGLLVVAGCAQKKPEKFVPPYCYLKPVDKATWTFLSMDEVCDQEDMIRREACIGSYVSNQERLNDIRRAIKNLSREDVKEHKRTFYADLLSKSLKAINCRFFKDCPRNYLKLVKDCDKVPPNLTVE